MADGEMRAGTSEDISMANRNFPQSRVYGFHLMPVRIDGTISIGSSGAPTISSALGVASITRLSAGRYRVQLQDNYSSLISVKASFRSQVTGSNVTAGSFSVGTVYEITGLGTTNWATAGLPAGLTAAVGMTFAAAAVGSGTGTAKAISNSGIVSVEGIGSAPTAMLSNQPFQAGSGGYVDFQCLAPTSSSVTTLIPADPASGSTMVIEIIVNNSSVQ